uniref:Ligase n=1 Tax=Thermosporothrix sp. COM3 TaxID=2490863 RepID=A0A455SN05_9CHLR|nr:ligase [Thermosporothrix sp. COM3]
MNRFCTQNANWNIIPLTITDQQQHIDRYETLFDSIRPGDQPILYWSLAERPGLVLGFSQKQEHLNQSALAELQIPVYRRRSGGTTVLVGPQLLCLDVILPPDHPLIQHDIVESYRWFGEAWVAALHRLDIDTEVISPEAAHAQRALLKQPETQAYERLMNRACYGTLSPYEVVTGLRKVVGLCMVRRRSGSLLQAGVVMHWESELLAQTLGTTPEEQALLREGLPKRVAGLDELAGRAVGINEVIRAFEEVVTPVPEGA